MSSILGISAFYHDSAACILIDGEIIAAAQEERFTRKKHDPRYPHNAINFVLEYANLKLSEVDQIVFFEIKGKSHLVLNDLEIDRGNTEAKVDKILNIREFAGDDKKISITSILKNIIKIYKPKKIKVPYNFPSYLFKKLKLQKLFISY